MAVSDQIAICQKALVLIGAKPITSFSDISTEAVVSANVYLDVVKAALSTYPWRFAMDQYELQQLSQAPTDIWSYGYQLPENLVLPVTVTQLGMTQDYDRYGSKIFTNADNSVNPVVLSYIFLADESLWLPHFRMAVIYDLASLFAVAVAGREDLASQYAQRAEKAYAIARSQEGQSQTNTNITSTQLVRVRR